MTTFYDLQPPTRLASIAELRALREPLRLMAAGRRLHSDPAPPRTIITVPGYGATDASMAPLRAFLRRHGHDVRGWGLGKNTGEVEDLYPKLGASVRSCSIASGTTVDLIGWSLGGVLAREVARDHPQSVGRVITYGTPVIGGPRFSRAAGLYSDQRLSEIDELIHEREQTPIIPPVTAIYSRNDGVVAWQACIDPFPNNVEHVEVRSTHLGMGLDPDVWRVVADRLGSSGQAAA